MIFIFVNGKNVHKTLIILSKLCYCYVYDSLVLVAQCKMLAQLEGLLFDPVYSGKGLAGLIDLTRQGYFDGMQNVVFLHTGGSAALFGYPNIFGLPGYN